MTVFVDIINSLETETYRRITLKLALKKVSGRVCTGFIWLKVITRRKTC